MSFQISTNPIDAKTLSEDFENHGAGAFASFEGRVRDHNEGKSVLELEYEADEKLCASEADAIFNEARERFDILDLKAVHRVGRLKIGELAVWVGCLAAHRDDAFKACRYVIDELKSRLPIWKKEFYTDEESQWINCQGCAAKTSDSVDEARYYEKQTKLPDIGPEGQRKLKETKVLVVGAGGLGTAALTSLVTSGFGTVGICEFDTLDVSNVHRQPLYNPSDAGRPKLELAVQKLNELNPHVTVLSHPFRLSPENIDIIDDYAIVLDCTDNFETKFLLNDACFLKNKYLVQASIYQYEGQLRVHNPQHSKSCLRCLWPDVPEAGCVGTCTDVGVIGTIPQVLGHLQAWEALKIVCNLPGRLHGKLMIFGLIDYKTQSVVEVPDPKCPLCSLEATIKDIDPKLYTSRSKNTPGKFIDIEQIPKEQLGEYIFVDIREPYECVMDPVRGISPISLPMSQISKDELPFKREKNYLIFCAKGIRSEYLVEELHKRGITNTYSINGGITQINNYIVS